MTCYSVLAVTPTNEDWIPGYLAPALEIITKHGGKYIARTTDHEQVEGDPQPAALRIILEWPSKAAALAFVNDPDYAPHLKARTEGSHSSHFIINGKDDLA